MRNVTWLAVHDGSVAYAMEAYPEELGRYRVELGDRLVSEHLTRVAAVITLTLRLLDWAAEDGRRKRASQGSGGVLHD